MCTHTCLHARARAALMVALLRPWGAQPVMVAALILMIGTPVLAGFVLYGIDSSSQVSRSGPTWPR